MGRMSRTAGITSSYTAHTIMADDLVAFQHEVPFAYPANVPLPWAETYRSQSQFRLDADHGQAADPRHRRRGANVLYSLFYRMSRSVMVDANGNVIPAAKQQTPLHQVRSNGFVDFRVTGRDIRLRIEIGALPGQPRPDVPCHGGPAFDRFGSSRGSLMASSHCRGRFSRAAVRVRWG